MASGGEPFSTHLCRLCFKVSSDPVELSCSHGFCKDCLRGHWRDKPERKCPVCEGRGSMDFLPPVFSSDPPFTPRAGVTDDEKTHQSQELRGDLRQVDLDQKIRESERRLNNLTLEANLERMQQNQLREMKRLQEEASGTSSTVNPSPGLRHGEHRKPKQDVTSAEPKGPRRLAEELRNICEVIETKGSRQIFKVPVEKDRMDIKGCARFIYGKDSMKTNCTIMVMGATGAGKSTLINGMINYILGVQWTDPYRFKLVNEEAKSQAESQTSEVTVYKINHDNRFMIDYSLTIIDTPGFGDTRGIQRDREITEQIRNLFSNDFGVNDIHAVCFVAQSPLARLSPTQRYVFDSVLSIFGKDVAENIRILVTFSDGQFPPVLEAIKKAEVPCPKDKDGQPSHYKFNNSALFSDNQTTAVSFDEMFWNMGKESMRSFFDALHKTEPKSLTLTKEVLQERKQLEESVNDLKRKVKEGLAKMDEIQQTEEQLKKNKAEIERNKDFDFTVEVIRPIMTNISGTGKYITNCQDCHQTCHYPCFIPDDANKKRCAAMDPNGNCKKCEGKCHWSKHYNQKYKWEYEEVTEKRTVEELKKNYLKGTEDKQTTEALISKLKQEYLRFEDNVKATVNEATRLINRLTEIALKPNPLSVPDYIDILIEEEKNNHEPGWKQRVASLEEMKETAELLQKVGKGEDILPPQGDHPNN